jgi:hypothetical protein
MLMVFFSCGKENLEQSAAVKIYTPNAFRPGSTVPCPSVDLDCNSKFKVIVDKPANLKSIGIQILDSKQTLVFNTTDFTIGWNGNFLNSETHVNCLQGQYFLVINYSDIANGNYVIKKNIYLIR